MFSILVHKIGGCFWLGAFDQDEITIGRLAGNHVVLPDLSVAPHHARVFVENGLFFWDRIPSEDEDLQLKENLFDLLILNLMDSIRVGVYTLTLVSDSPVKNKIGPIGLTSELICDLEGSNLKNHCMISAFIAQENGFRMKKDFLKHEIAIGRSPNNDIILQSPKISKRHARLVVKDQKMIIVDLLSTNGTHIDSRRINTPHVIKPGDWIHIGDFALSFEPGGLFDGSKYWR